MRSALVIFFSAFLILPIQNLSAQNYKLLWSDEFNESSLDAGIWTYETGNNKGWGNNEKEYYTNRPENLYLQNGVLVIQARKENYQGYEYTSARIKTQGKKFFQYGKIEARMKLPYGQGIWPAFWMLGENINSVSWPKCGEIDIMELIGGNKGGGGSGGDGTVFGTGHWFSQDAPNQHASYGSNYTLSSGRFADDFHIFAVTWDPKKIVWYIDDKPYVQLAITSSALSAFQKDFFIIFNLAVGGYWPGNPDSTTLFPQKMEVDYIRVYKDIGNFPSTSLIEPSDSSAFEANSNITLTASAETPSGSVSKVEFYQDALKIGETEVEPYQMTWGNVFPGQRATGRR